MNRIDKPFKNGDRIEYRILEAATPDKLEDVVNEEIARGWMLVGGVSACYKDTMIGPRTSVLQAMIRVTAETKPEKK